MNHQTNACLGSDVILSAAGGASYQWTGPNGFTNSGAQLNLSKVQFNNAGIYHLIAVSDKGCRKEDSTDLLVNPVPVVALSGTDHICEGTTTQLHATGGNRYVWSPSIALSSITTPDPLASPKDTTNYKVIVYNQYGCTDSARILINVWKKPVANAGPDKKTKEGIPVKLEGSATGTDVNYFWTPAAFLDKPDSLRPKATLTDDYVYTLTVVSNRGCGLSSDDVFVKVYKNVIVPNAFSPNGDGINDNWIIRGLSSYPDADLRVYNRYGQTIFHSKSYNTPWNGSYNGKPLPVGTYYYIIDLKIGEPPLNGWVFILR
jgi:gliding motility-associated-like protein